MKPWFYLSTRSSLGTRFPGDKPSLFPSMEPHTETGCGLEAHETMLCGSILVFSSGRALPTWRVRARFPSGGIIASARPPLLPPREVLAPRCPPPPPSKHSRVVASSARRGPYRCSSSCVAPPPLCLSPWTSLSALFAYFINLYYYY